MKFPQADDRVHEAVRAGRRIDFATVIDTHGHFGTWPSANAFCGRDADGVLRAMDAYGLDNVFFSTSLIGYGGSLSRANDEVLRVVKALPRRALGYCTLSSCRPERNLDELKRCFEMGLRLGVKMHRYHQPTYRLTDAFLQPIFEFLNERRLIYINHDLGPLDELRTVALRYPDIAFLSGHGALAHAEMGLQIPNIYANVCAMTEHRAVETLVNKCGSSHLLLGSDFCLFDASFGIGPVAFAKIPEEAKLDILGRNAQAILLRMEWFREEPLSIASTRENASGGVC